MTFLQIYLQALLLIFIMMTVLWIVSIAIKNVSIVDIFWGTGFVLTNIFYYISTGEPYSRKIILLVLVTIWGLRLSSYLAWRNAGKGEDFRYAEFRKNYGKGYWWISFFQTFILQGVLMWLISSTLLGVQYNTRGNGLNIADLAGIALWITGFIFEAGGDLQLARFRKDPSNKGKVLNTGLWHYTRHPNYFGDSAVWWGFGLLCIASGSWLPVLGAVLMTALIIRVSGVFLLEKSLKTGKPGYAEYIRRTSAFIPWFPKK